MSIVGFIESLDRLSFGGRVNTPSRLKHCLAWNGMLYKLLWHHVSHWGLVEGKGLSTSRVSPPGPLSLMGGARTEGYT